ncbi:MAG: hypothetical protein ACXITV_08865 [Luteibaculaceae bacterium]
MRSQFTIKRFKSSCLAFAGVLYAFSIFPQAEPISRPRVENWVLHPEMFTGSARFHTGVWPTNMNEISNFSNTDSVSLHSGSERLSLNQTFLDSSLVISPMVLSRFGGQFGSADKMVNTLAGGVSLRYNPTKKWSIYTDFFAFSEQLPTYLNDFVQANGVLPGIGTSTVTNGRATAANATALASYAPNEHFNFTAGHGKLHFGNGYRSLLFSDNAPNHFLVNASANVWRFKYNSFFTMFNAAALSPGDRSNYQQTFAASHHLSFNVNERLNISIFETVIWQNKDSLHNRGFDYNYLNPVVFYRPVEFSIGSSDKVQIGAEISYKLFKTTMLYGQVIIDEFNLEFIRNVDNWWGNKFGGQLGFKSLNPFKIKGLFLLGELSAVRPYVYSHYTPFQAFGHTNQPLAHPLGANFVELIGMLGYTKNNWYLHSRVSYARVGEDYAGRNYGSNIFLPNRTRVANEGVELLQGRLSELFWSTLELGYRLSAKNDAQVFIQSWARINRLESRPLEPTSSTQLYYIGLGFRSNLNDFYRDF